MSERTTSRTSSSLPFLLAGLALAAAPLSGRADLEQVERFHGTARGGDGAVLYLEEHVVRRAGERLLRATTTYRDPAGETIAVLRTDFSADPFAPSYRFEDRRRGTREVVEVEPDQVLLGAGRRVERLERAPGAPRLVAGQGLDRYVRHRLDDLERGAELKVAFAIPSRGDAYEFRVRAARVGADDPTVSVRVEIASWILRLFASSLDVEYDRATRRLLRYRGPSNLSDAGGENPLVEITYAYPDAGAARGKDPHAAL